MRVGSASSFTHVPHNKGVKSRPTDRKQANVCLVPRVKSFHRMGSNEPRQKIPDGARRDALYKYTDQVSVDIL